jgi:two-component system OmpR family sensor kinase
MKRASPSISPLAAAAADLQALFDGRDAALAGRAQLQLENAALKLQLAATQAELESFTYTVSHDLRASLRHITAFTQIVKEDWADGLSSGQPPDLTSPINTISTAARQMTLMIDGLMALSHLGQVELKPTSLDMAALVGDVRESLSGELGGRAIQWQIALDLAPNVASLVGDATLVRQVLRHVLSNAIKFTRHAPLAHIAIGWQPGENGRLEVFINDNGAGFNPQFQGKLFGVFQRLHSASQFEGIGMGLALSRRIMERHGGRIEATAKPGEGCEVRLIWPARET